MDEKRTDERASAAADHRPNPDAASVPPPFAHTSSPVRPTGDAPLKAGNGHAASTIRLGRGSLKHRAVRASAWVVAGMLATQALRFASNIILAQLLLPEHFGLMLIVTIVLQGMQMFSDVGIRGSIVSNAAGDQERFLNTAWTIQVVRGVILWVAICATAWPIARFYEEPQLVQVLPVIGINMVVYGLASTAPLTLTRHVRFGRQVAVQLIGQSVGVALMVAWAWMWPSVWAFVAGGIFQIAFQTAASYFLIPGYRNQFTWDPQAARQIFQFGKWIFVCTALQFFLMVGDKAVLGKLFSTREAGIFAIAVLLCESLVQILRKLSHEVLLPVYARLSESTDHQRFRSRTLQMRGLLLMVVLPPLWGLAVLGQPFVRLVYPADYAEAGWMLQILAMGAVGTVVTMTAERVTLARGDSFRATIVQAIRAVMLIGGMVIGFHIAGTTGVLIGVAAARLLDYPVVVWSIRRYGAWLPMLDLAAFALSATVIGFGIVLLEQHPL